MYFNVDIRGPRSKILRKGCFKKKNFFNGIGNEFFDFPLDFHKIYFLNNEKVMIK